MSTRYNGSNALRSCGGCGGSFLADDRNETYFCPKCTAAQPEFDPQPYAECKDQPDKQRVKYGPRLADHVVLARKGDMVTIRPLGFPDDDPVTVHVNNLRPPWVSYGH